MPNFILAKGKLFLLLFKLFVLFLEAIIDKYKLPKIIFGLPEVKDFFIVKFVWSNNSLIELML